MLDKKFIIENKMSWKDVIKRFDDSKTDEEIEVIMWEQTSYPFGTIDTILSDLKSYFKC